MKIFLSAVLVLSSAPMAPSAVLKWSPLAIPAVTPPVFDPALALEEGIQAQDIAGDIPAARKVFGKLAAFPSAPEVLRQEARRRLALLPPPEKPPGNAGDMIRRPVSSHPPIDPGVKLSGKIPLTLEVNVPPEVNEVKGTVDLWGEIKPPEPGLGSWKLPGGDDPLKQPRDRDQATVPASTPTPVLAPEPDFANLKFAIADIQKLAMTDIPSADLMNAAYEGIARRLHPEALFTPADPAGNSGKPLIGVGMMLSAYEEIICREVLPGSPAAQADIVPGTRILKIDGRTPFALGGSLEKVVRAIRGPEGSRVTFDIRLPDGTEKSITLARTPLSLSSRICQPLEKNADLTPRWMIAPGILAVRLTSTDPGAAGELRQQIQDPAHQPVKGLILDLSVNGGGSTGETGRILQLFVSGGAFYTRREKSGVTKTFANPEIPALFPSIPVVVLTSPRTAASAEVIAAALQDQHRAAVIGRRTMGRTVVFTTVPVPGGTIQVPVAELGRADGTPLERGPGMTEAGKWGVIPDIEVPEADRPAFVPRITKVFEEPGVKEVPVPAEFGNTHPLYEPDKTAKPLELLPPDFQRPAGPAPRDPAVIRALQYLHEQLGRK